MIQSPLVEELLEALRSTYKADEEEAPRHVEALLQDRLAEFSFEQRLAIVKQLLSKVAPAGEQSPTPGDTQLVTKVFSLILGKKVTPDELSSAELLERLAQSLNTIFDALNELIGVINTTLSAGDSSGEQTIRQFISFHLEGGDQTKPLEDYLGQINKAFLTTQNAFKNAAQIKMKQVLETLDPKKISAERGQGGLKIGPLRKAEDYDILVEKIKRIQRWFESGRFMEDFLREFEKNCQTFAMS
jgi:hypothetical protein